MAPARVSGERDSRNFLPSSVRKSPTRFAHVSSPAVQYGGMLCSKLTRFDGPQTSTPHANVSGVNVSPTIAA